MKRVKLTVAYDGTEYCGFQAQPGKKTVEGALNEALTSLLGKETAVIGASRTDSGVHALGNAAVFDTVSTIPADRFFAALNVRLPEDIRVTESVEVPSDWHPRHADCMKTYEYCVDTGFVPDPLRKRYAFHWPRKMDTEAMRKAAEVLVGEHDFTSFANPSSQVLIAGGSPVRKLTSIEIREEKGLEEGRPFLRIRVTGNGFLYNMVRIIAGTLLDVGCGRFTPEDVEAMLLARDRTKAGLTAEAKGLCLVSIHYQKKEF